MELIARGQIVGDPQQIYTLSVLIERRPSAPLQHPKLDYLADEQEAADNRAWFTDQLRRQHRAKVVENDAQLHKWIAAGELDEDCAILCRSLWIEDGKPEWIRETPVKPRHAPVQYIQAPVSVIAPEPEPVSNGHSDDWNGSQIRGMTALYGPPGHTYQVGITRYVVGENGEFLVDEREEQDIEMLVRAGARTRR